MASLSSVFGSSDPCPGTPKYLEVHYGCFEGKDTASVTWISFHEDDGSLSLTESESNSRTQPELIVPPWMTTSTPSPSAAFDIFGLDDLTTTKAAAEVTIKPTALPSEVTTNSGRRRVPITAAPTPRLSDHHNGGDRELSADDDHSRDSIQLNFNRMFKRVFNRVHYISSTKCSVESPVEQSVEIQSN